MQDDTQLSETKGSPHNPFEASTDGSSAIIYKMKTQYGKKSQRQPTVSTFFQFFFFFLKHNSETFFSDNRI